MLAEHGGLSTLAIVMYQAVQAVTEFIALCD